MGGLPQPVLGQQRALPKHCRSALELAVQCRHGKMPAQCHECARCVHGKQRQECRDCNAASRRWCPHNKRKHDCNQCSGCPHNRVKRCCKDCNGSAVCAHGRLRKNCRECCRVSLNEKCPHGRSRNRCNECRGLMGGHNVPSSSSSEHSVVSSGMHGHGCVSVGPPLQPPALDSGEGAGAGLGHESLAGLEDQHKQLSAEDASALDTPSHNAMMVHAQSAMQVLVHGQSAMQVLGEISSSSIAHEHTPFGSSLNSLKAHAVSPSHSHAHSHAQKVPPPASQEHSVGSAGMVEAGVGTGDDGASSLPPLRLCPHSKPRGECVECVKALALGVPHAPGGLGLDVGKKRPRDEYCLASSAKSDTTADDLKSPGAAGGGASAGDLLQHVPLSPAPSDGVICEHHRLRSDCESCIACRHGKMKSKCKECAVCEAHNRLRHDCRECNSGSRR